MRSKNPVQQKESCKYHTGYTIGRHKGEVHATQVVNV